MAESGDLIKEFKEAKPPEKAVIIGGIIAIIGIAWYLHVKSTASNQNTTNAGAAPTSQTAGYPMAGTNPVVPSGTNPLFDPSGNLIGWQNPAPAVPVPQPAPGPPGPGNPANWFTNLLGKVGYGTHVYAGGYDANGQRFYAGSNSNMFYAPIGSQIIQGGQGRIWLKPPGGNQQLLTGPGNPGFAQPGPGPTKQLTQVTKTAATVRH